MGEPVKWVVKGWCERCGKIFYTAHGKFCDNPACKGWVKHV